MELSKLIKDNKFRPDLKVSAQFYGIVEVYKKNRIKLKLDYIEARLTSDEFKMKGFQELLCLMKFFGDDE